MAGLVRVYSGFMRVRKVLSPDPPQQQTPVFPVHVASVRCEEQTPVKPNALATFGARRKLSA